MDHSIAKELQSALMREFNFRREGSWLRKGRCPECQKKELFIHAETPRVLKCGRLNRCGYEKSVRDYFPEIFDDWSKRFQPTEKDPHAAADAYLSHARGLDLMGMRGCYTQERYHDHARNIGSATVRFPLPGGGWWERLIDQPGRFDRKARFAPGQSYQGHWWSPPEATWETLAAATRIWICEGIFDAWALRQAGHVAVSAMTCNNWPGEALKKLRQTIIDSDQPGRNPELIFAFDIGLAGTEYTRKFVTRAQQEGWKAAAAQVQIEDGAKLDWNDLLLRDNLQPADIEEYLWNGRVLLSPSATEKACLIHERRKWASFALTFDNRTWWASIATTRVAEVMLKEGLTEYAALRACAEVTEIANCSFRTLYRERDEVIDDTAYYLRVDFPGKTSTAKGRFSSAMLTAAPEFKKRLFAFGGMYTGSTGQLDRLMAIQTRDLKTVEPIDFTGYSKSHGAWVLGNLAIKGGRVYHLNAEDYFDFGKQAVKLKSAERILDIEYDANELDTSWIEAIWIAYGPKGLVALAFWQATLFAEQIRAAQKSLGFLEITGEPGSGKSTLIEFLWTVFGRAEYEGFDPTKATNAAIARQLGKVGGLPVVLIEGDRGDEAPHSRKFEWDELKTAFNGRPVRSRGVKSAGNETYDPPFRGAIVIAQNYPVKASPALLERLLSMTIDKSGWSLATKEAAEQLECWPMERVSGFIVHIVKSEEQWLNTYFERFKFHDERLPITSGVTNRRLIKNHAQLAAALDALAKIIPIPANAIDSFHSFIAQMTAERHKAISSDHPTVVRFWEIYDWIVASESIDTPKPMNQSRTPETCIAVNLPLFEELCRGRGIQPPPMDELKKVLRSSKSRRYVADKTVNTRSGKSVHCWVFDPPKTPENQEREQ